MDYEMIMLRFGEFTIKGRNRMRFEKRLKDQVLRVLKPYPAALITQSFGRIYIELNGEPYHPIAQRLQDIFGIVSLSPVKRTVPDLEAIREAALDVMKGYDDTPRTFKASVRRVWKEFPHGSQEMNHLVGGHVLRRYPQLRVDVRHPEIELRVEIQQEAAYVFSEVVPTAGGFPYGTNGKAMLLLSGGIDSPVAGWHAMRKGLEVEAVHFYSFPFTSEQARDKVIELARRLSYYSGGTLRLHLVPFTDIQTSFVSSKQDPLMITLMRRAMLRITEKLAEQAGASAIVTGESLGQVASQTLASMNVIGRVVELPLLRPLVMMDKQEIINTAEKIGTFATSILPFEDCCTLFVPKSPSTNPNLRVVEKVESFIPQLDELLAKAIEETEVMELNAETDLSGETAGRDEWF
ncbi:tRNA uracil 4-sulfurtransferase ThiI [Paenibacillus abyssi]|uniref:Probable tRNA sulfurtransferase n=1 Tax=Paenibacillus abyssi TaxID=1340531 RepID=A0A917FX62_9BACL|nr:tRNA uracil 4-sulfurtransferase ThiI [Paenibacillus abyssi]GGG10458.1 putative tRNA sulfurtransferase [Paenibacillus abyssi]